MKILRIKILLIIIKGREDREVMKEFKEGKEGKEFKGKDKEII